MAGQRPRVEWSQDGQRATELPAPFSPSLSRQLVSLLAPSAWIRGDGWTDWPVGEDHSQKTLLIFHLLPRPQAHTRPPFFLFVVCSFRKHVASGHRKGKRVCFKPGFPPFISIPSRISFQMLPPSDLAFLFSYICFQYILSCVSEERSRYVLKSHFLHTKDVDRNI